MASLKDKMNDLIRQVRHGLDYAVQHADQTGKYKDYELAMTQVHAAEKKMKLVRAQVRTCMRKALKVFQDACPHETKTDTRVKQTYDGQRTVEFQTCSNCTKSFDLREKVQA